MKEKFIRSTFTLLMGGLITKILGMVIRIVTTRIIGTEALGLYTLTLPTFNLFITIATLSVPLAISKLVAEETRNNKKTVFGIIPLILLINLIIMLILILSSKFIAIKLLKNKLLYYPILSISFTLPFITISSIAKGYFIGKEKMFPNVLSNITEQITRILIIVFIIPKLLKYGTVQSVSLIILINIISELSGILILFVFAPKKFKIKKEYFKYDKTLIKDVYKISLPTTIGRLISSIGLFIEPIIITYIFTYLGYTTKYITYEYGILCGYVIPMVTMPQFLSSAISNALLPIISKYNSINMKNEVKKKLKKACILSLLISLPFTIIFIIFPKESLNLMFKTSIGYNYLKICAPLFIISYIIMPISFTIQGINKSKNIMIGNLINIITKTISLIFLSFLNIGMYIEVIATFIGYLITTIYFLKILNKYWTE